MRKQVKDLLCSKLPAPVQEAAIGTAVTDPSSDDPFIITFLKNTLPTVQINSEALPKEFVKAFTLSKIKRKTMRTPRLRKTLLSLKERRELGLYKLKRKGMKYSEFLPLHELWKEYITGYLDIEELEKHGFTATPDDRHWDNFTRLLLKADYHGAFLSVQKSICSSLVGKSGIVVFDTKNTFELLGEDNILRTIPKQSSVFCLKHKSYTFTILGRQFCIRPSDRSSKKIKAYLNLYL